MSKPVRTRLEHVTSGMPTAAWLLTSRLEPCRGKPKPILSVWSLRSWHASTGEQGGDVSGHQASEPAAPPATPLSLQLPLRPNLVPGNLC